MKLRLILYGLLGIAFSILGYYLGLNGFFENPLSSRHETIVIGVDQGLILPPQWARQFKSKTGTKLIVRTLKANLNEGDFAGATPDLLLTPLSTQLLLPIIMGEITSQKGLNHLEKDLASDFKWVSWTRNFPLLWTLPCPKLERANGRESPLLRMIFDFPFSTKSVRFIAAESESQTEKILSKLGLNIRWVPCASFSDPLLGQLEWPEAKQAPLPLAGDFNKLKTLILESQRELVLITLAWIPKTQPAPRLIREALLFFTDFNNLRSLAEMNAFSLTLNSSEEKVERKLRPSALKSWGLQQIFTPHKDHSAEWKSGS